jgi:putative transposase
MGMEKSKEAKIEELKTAERNATKKAEARRLLTVRLLMEGYIIPQVMQITNNSEKTVYNCRNRYEAEGVSGLATKPSTGKPNKLTSEQECELYETIKTKLPNQVGFAPFVNWTAPLAVQWVHEKYNVKFSERGMRDLFKRIGLSYTRPTYTLKKADPEKQEQFKKDFEQIKKTGY